MDCLFCSIVKGDIPSTKVYEDEYVYAFKDIEPQAPCHIIVIPKEHIVNILDIKDGSDVTVHIFEAIKKIAVQEGIDKTGFRVVSNCGEDAGQSVLHLHFHLLGGRKFDWPAGWY